MAKKFNLKWMILAFIVIAIFVSCTAFSVSYAAWVAPGKDTVKANAGTGKWMQYALILENDEHTTYELRPQSEGSDTYIANINRDSPVSFRLYYNNKVVTLTPAANNYVTQSEEDESLYHVEYVGVFTVYVNENDLRFEFNSLEDFKKNGDGILVSSTGEIITFGDSSGGWGILAKSLTITVHEGDIFTLITKGEQASVVGAIPGTLETTDKVTFKVKGDDKNKTHTYQIDRSSFSIFGYQTKIYEL